MSKVSVNYAVVKFFLGDYLIPQAALEVITWMILLTRIMNIPLLSITRHGMEKDFCLHNL
jgi:hypothetical protein